jgi:hypothetical protein
MQHLGCLRAKAALQSCTHRVCSLQEGKPLCPLYSRGPHLRMICSSACSCVLEKLLRHLLVCRQRTLHCESCWNEQRFWLPYETSRNQDACRGRLHTPWGGGRDAACSLFCRFCASIDPCSCATSLKVRRKCLYPGVIFQGARKAESQCDFLHQTCALQRFECRHCGTHTYTCVD